MDIVKIGEFLKALRKAKGYTQQEVADELYVTQKTVSRWENGEGIPDISIIISVAEFYEITVDELLKGERNNYNQSTRTIEKKNKSKVKLITNKLLSIQNIYFLVSMAILFTFIVAGILVGLLVDSKNDINSLAGVIIVTLGMIIGLITYLYGKSEVKRIINDEDNEQLKEELNKAKLELRRKNIWFLDIYLVLVISYVSLILWVFSFELTNVYFQAYDNYQLVGFIELILMIFVVVFSYIPFRKLYLKNMLNKNEIHKSLVLIMNVCIVVATITLFFSVYNFRYNISSTANKYENKIGLNIFLLFNSPVVKVYTHSIISLFLYAFSMLMFIIGNKKNKLIFTFTSLFLGCIANWIIHLDFVYYHRFRWSLDKTSITSIGMITLVTAIAIGIYLLVEKKEKLIVKE